VTSNVAYLEPHEIEARIAKEYAKELGACDVLTELYLTRCEPTWTGRDADGDADRLIVPEMGRLTKTFRASVSLARTGYGEQGCMLNRALFEGMGIMRWITANEDEAVRRFPRAQRWEEHQAAERANNSGLLEEGEALDAGLTETEVTEFTKEFGPRNEQMWTGTGGVYGLFSSIKGQFDEDEWKVIDNFRRLANTENNQMLHSSVGGLGQAVLAIDDDTYGVWTGPSDGMVFKALFGAFFSYHLAFDLYADRFELADVEELKKRIADSSYVFYPVPEGAERPGRNDPCFCGSGKKYKKCHGA
jgi:hypothetical protein